MNSTIQIISGVIETGTISFVVYMIMKGLKIEIKTLRKNIVAQKRIIKTMDKRIEETEKIGDLYKRLISDFPQALDDYQTVITKTKDSVIYELKSKIEDQNLTIEELSKISAKGGKQTSERANKIGKLFLDKENENLLEFISNLESDKSLTFKAMFENYNFSKFLASLNKEVKFVEEGGLKDIFRSELMKTSRQKDATLYRGIYMLTSENELIISERHFDIFKNRYESL
jgi:uncharacterized coiled-coil protein SlyX